MNKIKAVGIYLRKEFKSVAKEYVAPLVGLAKGRPISYTKDAYKTREEESQKNYQEFKNNLN